MSVSVWATVDTDGTRWGGGESGHLGSLPPDGMLYTHIQDSNGFQTNFSWESNNSHTSNL